MSKRMIFGKILSNDTVKLSKNDAKFLGLDKGKTLVLQVYQPYDDDEQHESFQATISVTDEQGRTPRAYS